MRKIVNKAFNKILLYKYRVAPAVILGYGKSNFLIHLVYKTTPYFFYNWEFINTLKKIQKDNGLINIDDKKLYSLVDSRFGFGPLMSLYTLCFYYGKLDILDQIREAALSSLNKIYKHVPNSFQKEYLKARALALAEARDYIGLQDLINRNEFMQAETELLYSLYFQLPQEYRKNLHLPKVALDANFKKYIHGKTVAIVGPAFSNEETGKEIDSFDVVIRINFKEDTDFGVPSLNGQRIDITYYSFGIAKNLDPSILKGSLLSYVVALRTTDKSYLNDNVRERRYSPVLLNGYPNMIQNVVYDVLLYTPAKVKVFNCDFYAGEANYDTSYLKSETNEDKLTIKNLALHDQWSQVCFIRNIYLSKLIEVDDSCRNILEMECSEYFSLLSSKYVS